MQPSSELIADLFRAAVAQARAMSPEDKLVAGPRLFDRSCRLMADGIRSRYPHADDVEVMARLREQLERIERLESA
jgi:hypothetical protein